MSDDKDPPPQLKGRTKTSTETRKFFKIRPDTRGGGKGHGVRTANKAALITPGLVVFAPPARKAMALRTCPRSRS
jgi:Protein of unknown function (DUF1629)